MPGLRPDLLNEKIDEVAEAIRLRPWLGQIVRDVKAGKKTSIVTITVGALVVTTAIGAGVELGVRRGQDLRELAKLLEKRRRRRKMRR